MKDHDTMTGLDFDECPVHGSEIVREYDFGMMDAKIVKWECGCCACQIGDSLDDCGTYHPSYPQAVGRARLGVAMAAAK